MPADRRVLRPDGVRAGGRVERADHVRSLQWSPRRLHLLASFERLLFTPRPDLRAVHPIPQCPPATARPEGPGAGWPAVARTTPARRPSPAAPAARCA